MMERERARDTREAERYRVSDGGKRERKEDWRKAQKEKWRRRRAMKEERGRE